MSEAQELLKIALAAADAADKVIMDAFSRGVSVEWKADNTPVTAADKGAEEIIRRTFAKETPGFGMIGEEFGVENPGAEYQWIVDPIDGTKSFIHGVPLFGTLIGLYHRNVPLAGVVRLPALKSCLYASKDGGAFVDGRRAKCSATATLDKALVLSGTLNTMEDKGYGEAFGKLRRQAYIYRGWGDCYGYYLVASGRAEAMVDPVVSLWDIAAFPCIFKEAGGAFSMIDGRTELFNADGKPAAPVYEGFTGMATNAPLADAVRGYFG